MTNQFGAGKNEKKENSPLVVDLPDGQKLMVGELPAGTVVEIATWRGTKRPDNRTTRLLLGVTNESATTMAQEPEVKKPRVDRRTKVKKQKSRRGLVNGLVALIALAALAFAFMVSPLRLVHPSAGASAGFGEANSALVVSIPVDKLTEKMPIVAYLGEEKSTVVLGAFSQEADGAVLISTGTGFAQTSKDKVIGRVIVVIPFLGKFFN